jgi:hypothetical protein
MRAFLPLAHDKQRAGALQLGKMLRRKRSTKIHVDETVALFG